MSIFSLANLFVNFAILRNSKINWKICLRGIFYISPCYKFLKRYTYLKLDHFIAHILAYHFLTFCETWWFSRWTPHRGENWKRYVILCFCNSKAVKTVYLLAYSVYLWNYHFLWVRDGYSKADIDTAIFVKQLLLKVWHNGKVYHSFKCCFSSAFKLLLNGPATS